MTSRTLLRAPARSLPTTCRATSPWSCRRICPVSTSTTSTATTASTTSTTGMTRTTRTTRTSTKWPPGRRRMPALAEVERRDRRQELVLLACLFFAVVIGAVVLHFGHARTDTSAPPATAASPTVVSAANTTSPRDSHRRRPVSVEWGTGRPVDAVDVPDPSPGRDRHQPLRGLVGALPALASRSPCPRRPAPRHGRGRRRYTRTSRSSAPSTGCHRFSLAPSSRSSSPADAIAVDHGHAPARSRRHRCDAEPDRGRASRLGANFRRRRAARILGHRHARDPALATDDDAMALALAEARAAAAEGEVPVGAVTLVDGRVVAARHNEREGTGDPTAHAEMLALRETAHRLGGLAPLRGHHGRHARTVPDVCRRTGRRPGWPAGLRGVRPPGRSLRDALQPLCRPAAQPRAPRDRRGARRRVRRAPFLLLRRQSEWPEAAKTGRTPV